MRARQGGRLSEVADELAKASALEERNLGLCGMNGLGRDISFAGPPPLPAGLE